MAVDTTLPGAFYRMLVASMAIITSFVSTYSTDVFGSLNTLFNEAKSSVTGKHIFPLSVSDSAMPAIPPVKVLVCTEALCPDCKAFDVKNLSTAFNTLGGTVIDLKLVPFGNALINCTEKTVQCQHGLGECDANSYEQCLIAAYPSPNEHLPVLACLFNELPMGHHDAKFDPHIFELCTSMSSLQFETIQTCHDNFNTSWELMEKASAATPSYHDHVPWIEIDGVYMDDETSDFFMEICKAYTARGGSNPACFGTDNEAETGSL